MKKKIVFKGCATALVTPMKKDGSVNYSLLETLVESQIQSGIDALVVCGTTGEKSTLSYDEHLKVIEVAVKSARKRVPIIAGTGSNNTAYSAELSNCADKLGADALLTVTPYYNKTSQTGLIKHFEYIADRVSKPLILYNVPSRTGININPETYKELSKHQNIVAVKEASANLSQIAEIRYLCGENLNIYSGNDDLLVPVLSLGGIGLISVISNILPEIFHKICIEYLNGNTDFARITQEKYLGLIKSLFCDVNPVPIKAAMRILGTDVGDCRLPLYKLNTKSKSFIEEKLSECDLI